MRLARISSRVRSSGASRSISSSKVRLASSIIAHSSPRTSMPWPAQALGVDAARLVAQLVDAQRVGQPPRRVDRDDRDARALGGQAHRQRGRRRRLAHAARARADDDALAAPARAAHSARSSSRARRASRQAVGVEDERQRDDRGAPSAAAQAPQLRALRRARARGRGGAARTAGRSGAASSARRLGGAEALGRSTPLTTTSVDLEPERRRAARRCRVERLVDRHLLGAWPPRRRPSARGRRASRRSYGPGGRSGPRARPRRRCAARSAPRPRGRSPGASRTTRS